MPGLTCMTSYSSRSPDREKRTTPAGDPTFWLPPHSLTRPLGGLTWPQEPQIHQDFFSDLSLCCHFLANACWLGPSPTMQIPFLAAIWKGSQTSMGEQVKAFGGNQDCIKFCKIWPFLKVFSSSYATDIPED